MQIKQALFSVFGETNLDSIITNVAPSKITKWKASNKTKSCYKKLFTLISSNQNDTFMARILGKVWPVSMLSDIKMAYCITVCQVMLSQHFEKFTMKEDFVKNRLIKNLVSKNKLNISKIF